MHDSSERLGLSFERYPADDMVCDTSEKRLESSAAICRVKEASIYLSKLRSEFKDLNLYDKGRYIYNLLVASKFVAADSSEYTALAIYFALDYFDKKQSTELYVYRAIIFDESFYYHEFCIIGYLGFTPGLNCKFDTLHDVYRNFTHGVVAAKLPWIVDATFNIAARIDSYYTQLYERLINKKNTGIIFSETHPLKLSNAFFRVCKDVSHLEGKDNFVIGPEISPVEYFDSMMRSNIAIQRVQKTSMESSFRDNWSSFQKTTSRAWKF